MVFDGSAKIPFDCPANRILWNPLVDLSVSGAQVFNGDCLRRFPMGYFFIKEKNKLAKNLIMT